jgi:hypothetical protein
VSQAPHIARTLTYEIRFTVSPRFKMRSEGEPVGMGDQIVLESKRFPNLGVHLSQST